MLIAMRSISHIFPDFEDIDNIYCKVKVELP